MRKSRSRIKIFLPDRLPRALDSLIMNLVIYTEQLQYFNRHRETDKFEQQGKQYEKHGAV